MWTVNEYIWYEREKNGELDTIFVLSRINLIVLSKITALVVFHIVNVKLRYYLTIRMQNYRCDNSQKNIYWNLKKMEVANENLPEDR